MDYPYQFVPEEVTWTEQVSGGPEVLKKLFQTNAERLFNLT
jgi:hypothetical protein